MTEQDPIEAAASEIIDLFGVDTKAAADYYLPRLCEIMRRRFTPAEPVQAPASEACPDGLLPDGPKCPRCGGNRAPSGVGGGTWVHFDPGQQKQPAPASDDERRKAAAASITDEQLRRLEATDRELPDGESQPTISDILLANKWELVTTYEDCGVESWSYPRELRKQWPRWAQEKHGTQHYWDQADAYALQMRINTHDVPPGD